MADLTTKYLGLSLRNPVIIGSSGLTDSVDNIVELEKAGAGAVVIKSLFEEQIMMEVDESLKDAYRNDMIYSAKSETLDYVDLHIRERTLSRYIELIKDAKKQVLIPLIASVNCLSSSEWLNYAVSLEDAGADALELNIALLPSDINMDEQKLEKIYYEIAERVSSKVNIPVALKISPYIYSMARIISQLPDKGVRGIVMFNRFYTPDFDINNFSEKTTNTYSSSYEAGNVLRWMAIMSSRVNCDLVASTGIHDAEAVIKQLLAGAKAVQMVSSIYKNGKDHIQTVLDGIDSWMEEKGYNTIDQFRAKMSQDSVSNPAAYERIQFMKYFSGLG